MRMASPWMTSGRLSGIGSHQTQVSDSGHREEYLGSHRLCPWQARGHFFPHLHPESVGLCQLGDLSHLSPICSPPAAEE